MAKVQTRRTISFSRVAYDAALEHASRLGISTAELATQALRAFGVAIPETHHTAPVPAAATRKAQKTRARRTGPRAAVKRLLPSRRKPIATPAVGLDDVGRALAEARASIPWRDGQSAAEERERDISRKAAEIMRKRGILLPENEGYAPGSWADPKNEARRVG